jgi:hypothetical protein
MPDRFDEALKIISKLFNLPVGQLACLDAGGRADTFYGGDLAQRLEPFGREDSQCTPRSLELVEFRQQGK